MKVKCIENDNYNKNKSKPSLLSVDKEYNVLEMLVEPDKQVYYRLNYDDKDSIDLFVANQFEVVSDNIPPNWTVSPLTDGSIIFTAKDWLEKDFWEKVFERDDKALEVYRKEARKIIQR